MKNNAACKYFLIDSTVKLPHLKSKKRLRSTVDHRNAFHLRNRR